MLDGLHTAKAASEWGLSSTYLLRRQLEFYDTLAYSNSLVGHWLAVFKILHLIWVRSGLSFYQATLVASVRDVDKLVFLWMIKNFHFKTTTLKIQMPPKDKIVIDISSDSDTDVTTGSSRNADNKLSLTELPASKPFSNLQMRDFKYSNPGTVSFFSFGGSL